MPVIITCFVRLLHFWPVLHVSTRLDGAVSTVHFVQYECKCVVLLYLMKFSFIIVKLVLNSIYYFSHVPVFCRCITVIYL